jgi:signal recognition particle subunit SRP54
VSPGQQVVKIVHDQLVEMLGADADPIDLNAVPPVPILMVGLQGSGKTTSTAKIARRLKDRAGRRVLMASLDTRRPAAQEQLAVLGKQVGVDTLPDRRRPECRADRAPRHGCRAARRLRRGDARHRGPRHGGRGPHGRGRRGEGGHEPHEVLLVADALTGQDAVNTARAFDGRLGVTGIVLTRMDGDARGGAALSMRAVTGKPIKLIGTGEKVDALDEFHPQRVANRILGMGDIVSLVERRRRTSTPRRPSASPTRCARASSTSRTCAISSRKWRRSAASAGCSACCPASPR